MSRRKKVPAEFNAVWEMLAREFLAKEEPWVKHERKALAKVCPHWESYVKNKAFQKWANKKHQASLRSKRAIDALFLICIWELERLRK